jgi:hypothetical protein
VDIYDAHTNQWSSTQLSQAREFVGGALGPALTEAALSPGLSEATASQAVDVYEVTSGRRGISPRPQPVSVRHADWCLTVGEAGPVVCLSECSIVVSTDP